MTCWPSRCSRVESAVKQRIRSAGLPRDGDARRVQLHRRRGNRSDENRPAREARLDRGRSKRASRRTDRDRQDASRDRPRHRGREAARQRVWFQRAADLVCGFVEARDAKELGRYQRRLERVDLLIVDELGFFGGDEKLTTALLDRLAEQATAHQQARATRGGTARMAASPTRRVRRRLPPIRPNRRTRPRRRRRSVRLPATTEHAGGSVSRCRSGSVSRRRNHLRDRGAPAQYSWFPGASRGKRLGS